MRNGLPAVRPAGEAVAREAGACPLPRGRARLRRLQPALRQGPGGAFVAPGPRRPSPRRSGLEHGLTRGPGDEARLAEEAIAAGLPAHRRGGRRRHLEQRRQRDPADRASRSTLGPRARAAPAATSRRPSASPRATSGACCRIVLEGASRAIDVGQVEDKHFLNIAGFGYDVAVLEDSWSVGYLEGSALYLYCALRQLGSYRGFSLEMRGGRPGARPQPTCSW